MQQRVLVRSSSSSNFRSPPLDQDLLLALLRVACSACEGRLLLSANQAIPLPPRRGSFLCYFASQFRLLLVLASPSPKLDCWTTTILHSAQSLPQAHAPRARLRGYSQRLPASRYDSQLLSPAVQSPAAQSLRHTPETAQLELPRFVTVRSVPSQSPAAEIAAHSTPNTQHRSTATPAGTQALAASCSRCVARALRASAASPSAWPRERAPPRARRPGCACACTARARPSCRCGVP